jgi:hypothetical protein
VANAVMGHATVERTAITGSRNKVTLKSGLF